MSEVNESQALKVLVDNAWVKMVETISGDMPLSAKSVRGILVEAMQNAYRCGQDELKAEHLLIQEAMNEVHEARMEHASLSLAMAIMEVAGLPSVTINLDRLRAISKEFCAPVAHDPQTRNTTIEMQRRVGGVQ